MGSVVCLDLNHASHNHSTPDGDSHASKPGVYRKDVYATDDEIQIRCKSDRKLNCDISLEFQAVEKELHPRVCYLSAYGGYDSRFLVGHLD